MRRLRLLFLSALLPVLIPSFPGPVAAQVRSSVGAGVSFPAGDLGDVTGTGYTVRGQVGVALGLFDAHVQAGWSRFPGETYPVEDGVVEGEDVDTWHAGVGVRLGFGIAWVGGTVDYVFGDFDDGFGFAPEVGVGFGPVEVVADYLFGGTNWAGLRAGFRF